MKLTFAELRLIASLKRDIEQGNISRALQAVFSMKDVLNKLSIIKGEV